MRWMKLAVVLVVLVVGASRVDAAEKPHAVFVVGTAHYSPDTTMPPLAKALEPFGFRTTVVMPAEDPERDPKGMVGLEKLKEADVAVFFMRFLTLPEDQFRHILDYVKAGKPVVGFRTSTHAFSYPKDHPLQKWNRAFGQDVLGAPYAGHLSGKTEVKPLEAGLAHPILRGFGREPVTAAGTLYRATPHAEAVLLLEGTGSSKGGQVEQAPVMWAWKNQWGGRVFTSTVGHVGSFAEPRLVRLMINGVCWAADHPVPDASAAIGPIEPAERVLKARPKKKQR